VLPIDSLGLDSDGGGLPVTSGFRTCRVINGLSVTTNWTLQCRFFRFEKSDNPRVTFATVILEAVSLLALIIESLEPIYSPNLELELIIG